MRHEIQRYSRRPAQVMFRWFVAGLHANHTCLFLEETNRHDFHAVSGASSSCGVLRSIVLVSPHDVATYLNPLILLSLRVLEDRIASEENPAHNTSRFILIVHLPSTQ